MNALNTPLAELDPEVHATLRAELHRQQSTLEMIASQNFAPTPLVTSGLGIGTPAPATRGFTEEDFAEVADIIALARRPGPDPAALRARTEALALKHPLHPHLSGDTR